MKASLTVLGAGIIGISCALELQRRGCQVTLVDRRAPGEETSAGNAGVLSYSNITPLASPELLPRVHRLMLNLDADFRLHYPHLLQLLPWLTRFALRCRRDRFLEDGQAMAALAFPSIELHKQWIREAGADSLLNSVGVLKLYRNDKTFRRNSLERELYDLCELNYRVLAPDQIRDCEPDLYPVFSKGVLIDHSLSIRNPEKLCKAYAQLFVDAGGVIQQDQVRSLVQIDDGWRIIGETQPRVVEKLVLCLGAWTPTLFGQLGYSNPIAVERGYHTIFSAQSGKSLSRPIFDVDASYVMAPMEAGLRLSTGSNLCWREAAPTSAQIDRAIPRAREAFPVDRIILEEPWMGRRPTLPDTLPIIGPAPRHKNLWLAFAHSHMGLTMGPMTGRLVANFVCGQDQPAVVEACSPGRYLS